MENIKLSVLQKPLAWEKPEKNRQKIEKIIRTAVKGSHLLVLPEMFTTGFSENTDLAETMQGETVNWMKKLASEFDLAITGSVMIAENDKFYNRLLFAKPDGEIVHYDKRHLFSYAGEEKTYTKGEHRVIVNYKGWRFCTLICYDLRFPVWSRCQTDYDVLLYVANWPDKRIDTWDALLKARAIENMAYCVGVNITGKDGKGLVYPGHSTIYNYFGKQLAFGDNDKEILTVSLSKKDLETARAKFPALNDADEFTLL